MEDYSPFFVQMIEKNRPEAAAWISGNADHPGLGGIVRFYAVPFGGIIVNAEIFGLTDEAAVSGGTNAPGKAIGISSGTGAASHFYAMHIHENGDCTPPFDKTGMHYNPSSATHPQHAGDLLPLLGNDGYAWLVFYDGRLSIEELVGRSVIIHANRDDFTTQPSGDSGTKIGCGTIETVRYL